MLNLLIVLTHNVKMSDRNIIGIIAKSNAGRLRRYNNDRYIVTNDIYGLDWRLPLGPYDNAGYGSMMAIADGTGSSDAGNIASDIAIDSVQKYFQNLQNINLKEVQIFETLVDALLLSHHAILNYANNHPEEESMRTAFILAWIVNENLYVIQCGNCKCFHYKPGVGMKGVSKNDLSERSLLNKEITNTRYHYQNQNNGITPNLGDPEWRPQFDISVTNLAKDDIILMCSDGLTLMLTDKEIEQIIQANSMDINSCTNELIEKANAAGGMDNITIISTRVHHSSIKTSKCDASTILETVYDRTAKRQISWIKKLAPLLCVISIFILLSAAFIPFLASLDNSKKHAVPAYKSTDTSHSDEDTEKYNGEAKTNDKNQHKNNRPDSSDSARPVKINSLELNSFKKITANNEDRPLQKGSFKKANINGDINKEEE